MHSALPAARWTTAVALVAGATLWLALWVFYEMADDTPKGEFSAWDEPLLRRVRGEPGAVQGAAPVATLARGVTFLGGSVSLTIIAAVGFAWLAGHRRWRAAVILAVAALGASLGTVLLKQHFMRLRPTAVPHWTEESSWSFPSGHALSSAAIYLTLGVLLARGLSGRAAQSVTIAGAFALSFLIGLSRIYLGVHYPTDVLAGWSAGTAWAIICSAGLIWWEHGAPGPAGKSSR